jgi:DNA-binding CsgD family transcriptional regulator
MAVAITTIPFVGREHELQRLLARLTLACEGHGGVVLLAGEPGIGKSRTAEEFAAAAAEHGARVLWGGCLEGEGAPAFWPWTQVLRTHARDRDLAMLQAELGDGGPDLAEIAPALRERLPDLPLLPFTAPDPSRFRLFDATTRLLWHVARESPLVLIIDDLHQADVPSLRLLEWVARELDGARHAPDEPKLLIVGTYRDTDIGDEHPFTATLAELARLIGSERLELTGLSDAEIARAITLSTDRASNPDLVAAVHAETEGNPFFLVEVLRLLAAEGVLDRTWPAGGIQVPPTVRAVIGRRLERLSLEARRVLGAASVAGREFSLVVLRRVSGLDGERLLALVAEAEQARVILPVADSLDRYRFGHALIRETLYRGLPRALRVRLHEQVGEAIEAMTAADPEPHLAELAHHFRQAAAAGEAWATRAVTYARRAGDRALATYAYEEAVRHYELALQALDLQLPANVADREEERCELLLALAQAQTLSGAFETARATILQAAALVRRRQAPEPLARAALSLVLPYPIPGYVDPPTIALLEEALSLLADDRGAMRARVMVSLAKALYSVPDMAARRTALGEEAVSIARRLGDEQVLQEVLAGAWWALAEPGRLRERLAIATELLELANATGRRDLAFYGRALRFLDVSILGDVASLDRELVICARLADELRHVYSNLVVDTMLCHRATLDGRFAEVVRVHELAESRYGPVQDPWTWVATLVGRLATWLELNREQDLLDLAERLIAEGFALHHPGLRCVRLLVLTRLGRAAEVTSELNELSAAGFGNVPQDQSTLLCLALLAEVCAARDDGDRAAALYELLLPYEAWFISCGGCFLGATTRYLGLLAATLGRWEEAVRHFEDAMAGNDQIGARPWLAWTQYDYAAALLRRANDERGTMNDELRRARALLEAARRTARELEMPSLAADAERLLAEVGSRTPTYPDRLTAREVEVLCLVAQRMSNNEIAAALVLSVRTVERHITNIYQKAGLHDRREARAYALTHGLIDREEVQSR